MEYIRCQAEWDAARLRLLASAGQLNRAAVDRGNWAISTSGPGGTATSGVTANIDSDHFQVTVQKTAGQPLVGVPVYLFDASDNYLSLSQTIDTSGMAVFAVTGGSYKVRADYMANQFWSNVAQVTGDTAITLTIPHQQVEVTVTASSGPLQGVQGVPVYLFTDTASYLFLQQTTDAAGKVSFDLPVGKNFKFRVDVVGNQYWSDVITVSDSSVTAVIIDTSGD
jgi:hypothetical protein